MAYQHYEIPRRHRHCVKGQEEFVPGSSYYSLIEPAESGGYARKDYCSACWQACSVEHAFLSDGTVFWKSSVPKKIEVSEESLRRDERALNLLKEYCQSDVSEELAQAFVLALLLTRKRLLQLKQEINEEGKAMSLYEVRATEEILCVQKAMLTSVEANRVRMALAEKLGATA
jgi:hypothetical protein